MLAENLVNELQEISGARVTFAGDEIREQSKQGNNRFELHLLIGFESRVHLFRLVQVFAGEIPCRLGGQAQRSYPVDGSRLQNYKVARTLVERDHWYFMGEAPVGITEPEAFLFEQVDRKGFLRKLSKFGNSFGFRHAVPEGTAWPVIDVCGSDTEIFLVTSSPVSLDLQINLRLGDPKHLHLSEA